MWAVEAGRFTIWNGSTAVRPFSLSKPSLRANLQEFPIGLPRSGRFWCNDPKRLQQSADLMLGQLDSNLQPDRYERQNIDQLR